MPDSRYSVVDAGEASDAVVERFSISLLWLWRHGVSVTGGGQHHVTAAVGWRETFARETEKILADNTSVKCQRRWNIEEYQKFNSIICEINVINCLRCNGMKLFPHTTRLNLLVVRYHNSVAKVQYTNDDAE